MRQDRAEIDDADPGAQTAVRLAEFAPDRAAADDDQMLGLKPISKIVSLVK